ncbi:hypothetical protein, partial [Stenotrophomonas maltophilia]|uniref:hypothetical protein n=1 Tax=Stenotrophomonas maltophilia TaxID=40324 RepID=UPI001952B591
MSYKLEVPPLQPSLASVLLGGFGSDNALREYGEGVLGEAAPDLVLVFPGGRLASELVQVAHAADVPLMLAYR